MRSIDPPSSLQIGTLALTVRDLDRVAGFYRDVVGLRVLERGRDTAWLGAGSTGLLRLDRNADARPASPRDAGLFHVAFLLPNRADLARWAVYAMRNRVPVEGAADHGVSEAFYLSDPEGNGVEITTDRLRAAWPWRGDTLAMVSDPLDMETLLRDAGPDAWHGAPEGTTIGHVHLRVGAVAPAEAFYAGVLGLPITARVPGAGFFGADRYHHHLAANTWTSRDAGPRAAGAAGLAEVGIRVADAAVLDGIAQRATAAGIAASMHGPDLSLNDPWGTSFILTAREA